MSSNFELIQKKRKTETSSQPLPQCKREKEGERAERRSRAKLPHQERGQGMEREFQAQGMTYI